MVTRESTNYAKELINYNATRAILPGGFPLNEKSNIIKCRDYDRLSRNGLLTDPVINNMKIKA